MLRFPHFFTAVAVLFIAQGCILDEVKTFTSLLSCQDADGDTYGLNCQAGPDCNDIDPNVNARIDVYNDVDGDGVGGLPSGNACILPDSVKGAYTPVGGDCNDNDETLFQNLDGYGDLDGDTYHSPNSTPVCSGETLPEPYVADAPADGDADCNDNDASIHPGAADPAGDFIDQNCDGADTLPSNDDGVFVTKSGSDSNSGTISNPFLTVAHAIANVGTGDSVFVAKGTYHEFVTPENNLFGGYNNAFDARDVVANETVLRAPSVAMPVVLVPNDETPPVVILAGLTLRSETGGTQTFVENHGVLTLSRVKILGSLDSGVQTGLYTMNTLTVLNSKILSLESDGDAVYGIHSDCSPPCKITIKGSTIQNEGSTDSGSYGVRHNYGTLVVDSSTIDAGEASSDAIGIRAYSHTRIINSTIRTGYGSDSAIGISFDVEDPSEIVIVNSSIEAGESNSWSAGIDGYFWPANMQILNSAISTDYSDEKSVGLYATGAANINIYNTTIMPGPAYSESIGIQTVGTNIKLDTSKVVGGLLTGCCEFNRSIGVNQEYGHLNAFSSTIQGGAAYGLARLSVGIWGEDSRLNLTNNTIEASRLDLIGLLYEDEFGEKPSNPFDGYGYGYGIFDQADYGYSGQPLTYGDANIQSNRIHGGNGLLGVGVLRFQDDDDDLFSLRNNSIVGVENAGSGFMGGGVLTLGDAYGYGEGYGSTIENNTITAGGTTGYLSFGVMNFGQFNYRNNTISGDQSFGSSYGVRTAGGQFDGNRITAGFMSTDLSYYGYGDFFHVGYGVLDESCVDGYYGTQFVNNFIDAGDIGQDLSSVYGNPYEEYGYGYGFGYGELVGFGRPYGYPDDPCFTQLVHNTITSGHLNMHPLDYGRTGLASEGSGDYYDVDFWVINNIIEGGLGFEWSAPVVNDDDGDNNRMLFHGNLLYNPFGETLMNDDNDQLTTVAEINNCNWYNCDSASGNIAANPGINFMTNNFHISSGSPAVNKGVNAASLLDNSLEGLGHDIDGQVRPATLSDIGADEVQ